MRDAWPPSGCIFEFSETFGFTFLTQLFSQNTELQRFAKNHFTSDVLGEMAEAEANKSVDGNITEENTSILDWIVEGKWNIVEAWCKAHPEEILGHVDPSNGSTILHAICSIAGAPVSLFRVVVDIWPEATTVQEKRYGATPLHLLCWNFQRSPEKVEVLLGRMKPEDLMIRNNVLGSNALHSACGSHADLSVIKAIVRKHPPLLLAKTFDQHTALNALWHSHLQSIPMHLQIGRILRGQEGDEEILRKLLEKMNFLAMESFKLSHAYPEDLGTEEELLSKYILHGMLDMKAPVDAILVALKLNPKLASHPDLHGNYPLHHAVIRRPFRIKYTALLRELLNAYPEAALKRNKLGDAPIHIAIIERMSWEDGLGQLVKADYDGLGLPDRQTGLFPALLAASLGGNVAVNTTFCLLTAKPDLIGFACNSC